MYSRPSSSSFFSSSIVLPVDTSTSSSFSGSRISSKKFPASLPPRSTLINNHNKIAGEGYRQHGHRRVLIHLEGAQRAATIVSEAVLDLSAESESESEDPREESTSKKIKAGELINGRTHGTTMIVNEEKAEEEEEADRKWITNLIEKGTEADLKHREALIGLNRMIGERMRKPAPTMPVAPPMMRSVKNGPKRVVAEEENIRDKLLEEIRRTGGVEGLRRRGQVNGNT